MKRLLFIVLFSAVAVCSHGQTVDAVLREIERNNPALKAAAAEVEAEVLAGKAEALLENPEVEFNYLFGGAGIGNRHDVRVSQSFDIPTITGMKAGKAADLGELAALRYKAERQAVLLEAKQACIDLIYWNALIGELDVHLEQAEDLVSSYEKRMTAGEATILDLNKARIHRTNIQGQANRAEVERQGLLAALRSLNGGTDPGFDASAHGLTESLPEDFETWFEEASSASPVLGYVRKEVLLEERQLSIDKASRFPELVVGYMSEIRTAEKFRGVTVGMSIPLWSSSNKVRQTKARADAARERQNAAEQGFFQDIQRQYLEASSMKKNAELMRASLKESDSRSFLLSALTEGEISMIDYLVEIDLYFDALEQALAAERDYRHALASLMVFSL
jgi:outer membrane protein TolC